MTYDPIQALDRMSNKNGGEAAEFEALLQNAKSHKRDRDRLQDKARKATDYEWRQLLLEERRERKAREKAEHKHALHIAEQIVGIFKVASIVLLCVFVYLVESCLSP